jgi:sulfatase maturation enzyme AslB (radical SAM superfamily)
MQNPFKRVKEIVEKNKLLFHDKVFCLAPWVHVHATPDGNAYPCCMSVWSEEANLGNFKKGDSIMDVFNSRRMKAIRKDMLQGKKLGLCERCYKLDEQGKGSFRQGVNYQMQNHFDRVANTDDGFVDVKTIPYLDIRFSNVCNFKCRICSHTFSSSWYDDMKHLDGGYTEKNPDRVMEVSDDMDAFFRDLKPHLEALEYIQFGGGEPLLMKQHYEILDYLLKNQRFDVKITYNTNLSVHKFGNYDAIEMWSHFNDVLVMASLDGMKEVGEYLRKGQNWNQTLEFRKRMLDVCPNVKFRIDPTITLHNVFQIPEFYSSWLDSGYIGVNDIFINILTLPGRYSIKTLRKEDREKVTKHYAEFISQYLKKQKGVDKKTVRQFQSVIDYVNEPEGKLSKLVGRDKVEEQINRRNLRVMDEKLDEIRGENFRTTFPHLKDY